MSNLNLCQIIGRLGKDPDVRYMPNGDAVANLSVAVSESWKDKTTGERRETTEWFRVVMFRKQAEIAGEHLRKGSLVYLSGKIKTREYEKDGQKRYVTELHADELRFLERKADGEPQAQPARQASAPAAPADDGLGFDQDVPF
jgi:single-strand DNA-binding protein